jgi:hypothetical protein
LTKVKFFAIFDFMAKVLSICFLAAGLCFAQNPFDVQLQTPPQEGSAPVEVAPATPAPIVEPPPSPPVPEQKAPSGKTAFDVLRGHAYNPFSTVGAANSVSDLVSTPSDINGQKFIYVSPDRLGYAAFDLSGGSTMLLGFDNSSNLGALILGYANPAFGVALNYSIGKVWISSEVNDIDASRRTTSPGDNIGLYFSLPSGIYASAGWLTYGNSSATSIDGDDSKVDYSAITASVGKLGSSGSLSYDAYLNVIRYGGSATNDDGDKAVTQDAYLGALLNFDFGYAALQKEKAKVIVGLNNMVGMAFLDKIKGYSKSDNVIFAKIQPNILGEVILAERWLAFVGAMQDLYLLAGDADRNKNTSELLITQTPTETLFAGMRYQRANIALEAQVSNNPFGALAGRNILTQLGGFIYF